MQKIWLVLLGLMFTGRFHALAQDTFSIVAVDEETGEVGSAGASCVDLFNTSETSDDFLGELFPGKGAINTQAAYDKTNQKNARERMNAGDSPQQIIDWLVANDVSSNASSRQYGVVGIVNGKPLAAAYTGSGTMDYKGHITGQNYSIQGNILSGKQVLDSIEARFNLADGNLACKLMAALQGAKMVGADSRCKSNGTSSLFSFIKVAQPNDPFGSPSFLLSVRTRGSAQIEPIDSLQSLFNAAMNCTTNTNVGTLQKNKDALKVYPNPGKGNFMLSLEENTTMVNFAIFDVRGNKIHSGKILQTIEVDTVNWPKGIYVVKLIHKNQLLIKRIVKN